MYPGQTGLPWFGYPSPYLYPGTSADLFAWVAGNNPAGSSPRHYYIRDGRRSVK